MHIFGYDMPRLHAALNDLPAALLVVAVLFELAAWAWKRESLKWAALWTLWAGVIGGWAAGCAGGPAEGAVGEDHGEGRHERLGSPETLGRLTRGGFTAG